MSARDVVYCLLTALFAAAAVHGLRQGVLSRSPGRRRRVDQLLHAAMALAMAAMPWSWGGVLPDAAQTVLFATAALWFPLTAVRRRHESGLLATARRMPHAAGMAAMAWMGWMGHATVGRSHENLAGVLPAAPHAGHLAHAAGEPAAGEAVTAVLALYLLACGLRSLTRQMLRSAAGPADPVDGPALRESYGLFWDGLMFLGTAVTLLMPH
ncbi:DUF5134 domain-containing protein [Streptomyces sp. NPDC005318]|uniref:DUF5134 domain-containing protein n=1 Tax=Streptomyces sp. NPDC005318 TaxID=3157031 RepID=UPI0033B00119